MRNFKDVEIKQILFGFRIANVILAILQIIAAFVALFSVLSFDITNILILKLIVFSVL